MVDTLEFTSDRDLYKMISGVRDHYDYSLSGDSILITYNGVAMPYIYMGPSKMRFYELTGKDLTIDFRNAYYGFSNQIILFHRK
jgi:carbohydrate-binding DOMON domain-containing protein